MESIDDISYGTVPLFYDGSNWQVLLIHQISHRGGRNTFWIFPKGHPEAGESPIAAALRELAEETGLTEVTVRSEAPITVAYSFVHEHIRINKRVEFFMVECSSKVTTITQPEEVLAVRWCTLDEAAELLTHQNSKDVLQEVRRRLACTDDSLQTDMHSA